MTDRRITVIVADDEEISREGLAALLAAEPGVTLLATCADGTEVLEKLKHLQPDVLFLDVQMPRLDGFSLLEELPAESRPLIVFATAYDSYALEAFEASAVDYLLKPFSLRRLRESLRRIRLQCTAHEQQQNLEELFSVLQGSKPRKIWVPARDGRIGVDVTSIQAVSSDGNYVTFFCENSEEHLMRATLTDIEKRLSSAGFLRSHRSWLVQKAAVKKIRELDDGTAELLLSSGHTVPVSRRRRTKVIRDISQ